MSTPTPSDPAPFGSTPAPSGPAPAPSGPAPSPSDLAPFGAQPGSPNPFALTPRQRRLRVVTVLLLVSIALMIGVGIRHPFFHITPPPVMTPVIRKALAVKGIMILGYWTCCILLTLSLMLVAWLDLREVRRKLLEARVQMWRQIATNARERQRGPKDL